MERPRRIAEMIAGHPYRVLAATFPYDFDHLVPGLVLDGQKMSVDMTVQMLKEQAPIIYADDVLDDLGRSALGDNIDLKDPSVSKRYWGEIFKMLSAPRSIPPYDQLFVDAMVPHWFKPSDRPHFGMTETPAIAAFVKLDPIRYLFPKSHEKVSEELDIFFAGLYLKMQYRDDPSKAQKDDNILLDTLKRMRTLKKVAIFPYYQRSTGTVYGPWGMSIYVLDENYRMLRPEGVKDESAMMLTHFDMAEAKTDKPLPHSAFISVKSNNDRMCAIAIQTISLLNCSNVRLVETGRTNQDLSKKRRETARLPFVRHHELRVKVGQNEVRVNGRSENGIMLNPLHTVRGHFKDYSTGKGLFGKYHYSCVWCPPFVRGHAEDGIVTRDYVLEQGVPQ